MAVHRCGIARRDPAGGWHPDDLPRDGSPDNDSRRRRQLPSPSHVRRVKGGKAASRRRHQGLWDGQRPRCLAFAGKYPCGAKCRYAAKCPCGTKGRCPNREGQRPRCLAFAGKCPCGAKCRYAAKCPCGTKGRCPNREGQRPRCPHQTRDMRHATRRIGLAGLARLAAKHPSPSSPLSSSSPLSPLAVPPICAAPTRLREGQRPRCPKLCRPYGATGWATSSLPEIAPPLRGCGRGNVLVARNCAAPTRLREGQRPRCPKLRRPYAAAGGATSPLPASDTGGATSPLPHLTRLSRLTASTEPEWHHRR